MHRLYAQLGRRIRKQRQRQRLSQDELASLTQLSRASISNIEAGRQQLYLHHLVSIAEALRIEPSSLISPMSEPQPDEQRELLEQTIRSGTIEKPKRRGGQ